MNCLLEKWGGGGGLEQCANSATLCGKVETVMQYLADEPIRPIGLHECGVRVARA